MTQKQPRVRRRGAGPIFASDCRRTHRRASNWLVPTGAQAKRRSPSRTRLTLRRSPGGAQPANPQRTVLGKLSCTRLYERESIFRYIHLARLISEARLVRSPMDIDRDQGPVGNNGPFLLTALRPTTYCAGSLSRTAKLHHKK
jgi:hypothetical protein